MPLFLLFSDVVSGEEVRPVLIYGLFNDAVSSADCIASNNMMLDE
jgi:hypothetical protein